LNRIVLETDLGETNDDARQLIEGWYGGPGLPNPTFNDDFVPTGWDKKDDKGNARQLYRHVVAPTCRSCHISHSGTSDPNKPDLEDEMDFRFGKYEDFTGRLKPLIYSDVCVNHSMPNAEQSLKVLWDSSARAHLLNRLDLAPSVFSSETSEKFECGP
jgi:hypothetical protein